MPRPLTRGRPISLRLATNDDQTVRTLSNWLDESPGTLLAAYLTERINDHDFIAWCDERQPAQSVATAASLVAVQRAAESVADDLDPAAPADVDSYSPCSCGALRLAGRSTYVLDDIRHTPTACYRIDVETEQAETTSERVYRLRDGLVDRLASSMNISPALVASTLSTTSAIMRNSIDADLNTAIARARAALDTDLPDDPGAEAF